MNRGIILCVLFWVGGFFSLHLASANDIKIFESRFIHWDEAALPTPELSLVDAISVLGKSDLWFGIDHDRYYLASAQIFVRESTEVVWVFKFWEGRGRGVHYVIVDMQKKVFFMTPEIASEMFPEK
jgi:PAS domain-containing protein